jgi:hypothetical protein
LACEVMLADAKTRGDKFRHGKRTRSAKHFAPSRGFLKTRCSRTAMRISSATWCMATSRISLRRWER